MTVLPVFVGVGKHARDDLPRLMAKLKATHPQIAFKLKPSIGEDFRVIELMARIALS